jgi:Bacterial extracellular solute-binding protein/von Willebrand factor type A domain
MSSGSHANRRRGVLGRLALALVVLALLAGGISYLVTKGPAAELVGAGSGDCDAESLEAVVAPRIAAVAKPALESLASDCLTVSVSERTERQALDDVFFGGPVPDVWIPDGDWGLAKMPVEVVSPGVASTPVLLVGGPSATPSPTWGEALATGVVAMPDPLDDSVGALTMLAPRQEAVAGDGDTRAAQAFLVPMAQDYGALASEGKSVDLSLDSITPATTRMVATTEAELLEALRTNRALRSLTPRTGTERLTFPLTVADGASQQIRDAADELVTWFGSEEGRAALRQKGLRRGNGAAVAQGAGVGRLTYLPTPASTQIDEQRLTWQVMSVPSSVLAVFDVSGSMDFPTPADGRRIDVAVGAAQVALEVFPGHARIGLWVFSIDRGGSGQDWRVMEPVRRLDAVVGGRTQRELLNTRSDEMRDMTTGGTGLNDTALAAYRRAVADYDPNYSNTMILITDGANDDPGSISERALIRRLKALVDPERPVRIVGIGISDDADLGALQRIAEATGGRAHRADTPEDILEVFASEIANR